jgi:hypothetical protein
MLKSKGDIKDAATVSSVRWTLRLCRQSGVGSEDEQIHLLKCLTSFILHDVNILSMKDGIIKQKRKIQVLKC